MKLHTIIIALFAPILFSSCNSWLDLTPEDTTTEKKIFSNFGGYHSTINGIYQTLAGEDLYGKNLSFGFVSALSQYYDNKSPNNNNTFSFTEQYEFNNKEVLDISEKIWETGYSVIANCNNTIKHIRQADISMFPFAHKDEHKLIEGEALAIRALMHFELLRLFAPAPTVDANSKAIPYSTTHPNIFEERSTVKEVIDKIILDFETAITLLESTDELLTGFQYPIYLNFTAAHFDYQSSSDGIFFSARGSRLNMYAVKVLLARAYLYAGNLDKAYEIANEVYTTFDMTNNKPSYYQYVQFTDTDNETTRSHKMLNDVMFASYFKELDTRYIKTTTSSSTIKDYALQTATYMFTEYQPDSDDFRYSKLTRQLSFDGTVSKGTIKYLPRGTSYTVENSLIPVVRISELAHIISEYKAKKVSIADAVNFLNQFRVKRGCMKRSIETTITIDQFMEELGYDVWKDGIAENGQYFFFCKRLNMPKIRKGETLIEMNQSKYIIPIPDSETSLNN